MSHSTKDKSAAGLKPVGPKLVSLKLVIRPLPYRLLN